ncbi:MAG: hypothetical protein WA093_04105 [Minisyncoccales bacterium]
MKRFNLKNEKGFVALISTAVISAVLLVAAASVSRAAFWARFDLLARENKKISVALAEACANIVLLGLADEGNDFPPEIAVEGVKKCKISEVGGNNPYTIITRADWKNSYTNLKVTAKLNKDSGKITISDWREF